MVSDFFLRGLLVVFIYLWIMYWCDWIQAYIYPDFYIIDYLSSIHTQPIQPAKKL